MESLKYIFIIILLSLTSCSDILDNNPRSNITSENFFNTEEDAVLAVNSIYRAMYLQNNHARPHLFLTILSTDDSKLKPYINNYQFDANYGGYLQQNWRAHYIMINRANLALSKIPDMDINENVKKRLLGEARFLRGLAYFRIVRFFGDVPLTTEPTTSLDNINIPRTPSDDVYTQIIEDLEYAEDNLLSSSDTEAGRATITAAKALLAKVYLTRENWDLAAEHANEIITAGDSRLMEEFPDVFLPENENNDEIIFDIQYKFGPGPSYQLKYYLPRDLPGSPEVARGLGRYLPSQELYDSYREGDLRRDWTLFTEYTYQGETVTFDPHWHKFMDYEGLSNTSDNETNFPLLRYADMLLTYAEALNEQNGPTTEAYEALNKVVRRAYGRDINSPSDVDITGLSQDEFSQEILDQRRWEFAGEYHRWYDLKRTDQLITVMSDWLNEQGFRDPDVDPRYSLYPIPQREMDTNPELEQNPGY